MIRPRRWDQMVAWLIVLAFIACGVAGFGIGFDFAMRHFKDEAVRVGHAHYRDGEFWWKAPKEQ